jgi:hypothetical protein
MLPGFEGYYHDIIIRVHPLEGYFALEKEGGHTTP